MCVHNDCTYVFFNPDVDLQVTLSTDNDNEDKGNDNVCKNSIFIIHANLHYGFFTWHNGLRPMNL